LNTTTKEENISDRIKILVIIIILFILVYFSKLRKEKEKELNDVKAKLRENEKLNEALQKRKRNYFTLIRWLIVIAYLTVNFLAYYSWCYGLDAILNTNGAIFIIISALTFARFGSFDSYNRWWYYWEIKVEISIYKNSPELKQIIAEQQEYKKSLEKEISDIDSFFKEVKKED